MADPTAQPVGFPGDAPDMSAEIGGMGGGMPQFHPPSPDQPDYTGGPIRQQGSGAQPKQQSTLKKILLGVFDTIATSQGFPNHYDYQRRELAQQQAQQRIDIEAANSRTAAQNAELMRQMTVAKIQEMQNTVPVTPDLVDKYPDLAPLLGGRLNMKQFLAHSEKANTVNAGLVKAGYDPQGRPLPVSSLAIPAQMKVEMAGLTTKLKQAQLEAATYDPNTPAGQAARIKLDAIRTQAGAAATRAAAAAGMEQIAAQKYAQDYVMGTTDEETGMPTGLNQAKLKAMQGKIPPAVAKIFGTYQQSKSRLAVMENSLDQGLKGDQQAMLNVLANHLGMTMGLQPGARMNQALIHEAEQSAPLLGRIQARYDDRGYLSGVVLTPKQMQSMVELARERVQQDARAVSETETYFGVRGHGTAAPKGGGGAAPEGTIIKMKDGSTRIKKGGQWVAQ